ncbi:MAG: hypothetical protein KAS18_06520, partial [Calditrichia bacterium]|nr:hypothetical protein [Calditrichia bacterium]
MDMVLKHRLFTHFNALFSLIFRFVLYFIFLLLVEFDRGAVLIFSIFFTVDAFPVIFLHIEYFLENYRKEYKIFPDKIIVKN